MNKTFNQKNAVIYLIGAGFCTVSGIVSGHAVCVHQHCDLGEANKLLRDENGNISYKTYFSNIIHDYKKMYEDPLGLDKQLS